MVTPASEHDVNSNSLHVWRPARLALASDWALALQLVTCCKARDGFDGGDDRQDEDHEKDQGQGSARGCRPRMRSTVSDKLMPSDAAGNMDTM